MSHWVTGLLMAMLSCGFVCGEEVPVPEVKTDGGEKPPELLLPPTSSESSTGQFLVFGEGQALRSTFCVEAEDVKKDLLKLLGRDDEWTNKILIVVSDDLRPGRAVVPRVFEMDGGRVRFQLDVRLNGDFRRAEFSQQVLRLLLAENMMGGEARAGTVVALPDWVAVGIAETIEFRKRARPSGRFASVFEAGKNLGVEAILEANPWTMDSVSREIYEASCCALMETLLTQPGGLVSMRKFIAALGEKRGTAKDLLYEYFPGLGISHTSLDKWWALQMSTLAEGGSFEVLGVKATEARLQEILEFTFTEEEKSEKRSFLKKIFGKKEDEPVRPEVIVEEGEEAADVDLPKVTLTLADAEEIMAREDRSGPLEEAKRRLERLRVRAYPLYRQLILGYENVLGAMVLGKEKNVREAIEVLAISRAETLARAREVESYMDWFEGTQLGARSGAFDDYQRAVEEMDALERRRRGDPISRYLDAVEKEY